MREATRDFRGEGRGGWVEGGEKLGVSAGGVQVGVGVGEGGATALRPLGPEQAASLDSGARTAPRRIPSFRHFAIPLIEQAAQGGPWLSPCNTSSCDHK